MTDQCSGCRHYLQRGPDERYGWCYRYPPVAVREDGSNANAPHVKDNRRACGEFVARPAEQPMETKTKVEPPKPAYMKGKK